MVGLHPEGVGKTPGSASGGRWVWVDPRVCLRREVGLGRPPWYLVEVTAAVGTHPTGMDSSKMYHLLYFKEYHVPMSKDIPEVFNVTLLKDAPNPLGVLGSKGVLHFFAIIYVLPIYNPSLFTDASILLNSRG